MRNGKLFIGLFTAAFLLAAAFFGKSEYAWDGTVSLTAQVVTAEATETITCWEGDDDMYYLFLPGYAQLSQVQLHTNVSNAVYLDGQALTEDTTCDNFPLGVPLELCYIAGGEEHAFSLVFVQSANVPALYIDTASGTMAHIHELKGNEEPGTLRLYDADGTLDYRGNLESIKGRGNSTWDYKKKPYNLTLNSEGDLLGMGGAKRWILLANAMDESQLKNKIAYDMAQAVGLEYSPDSQWVDLYLNGEYAGLYLLCERNEVHPSRVAIGEGDSFLVSKDWEWRFRSSGQPFITTQANTALRIHYSDLGEDALLDIWQSAENAILAEDGIDPVTGKHWRELIDLDSWAKKYLLEEMLGNLDASTLSQFFYYDSGDGTGKIYAGPVWDMDLTMKNTAPSWLDSKELFYGNVPGVWGSEWMHALYHQEAFYNRVTQLYETVFKPQAEQLLAGGIRDYGSSIRAAARMNALRWEISDTEQAENAIVEYLADRVEFLNRIWVEKEDYVIVTVKDFDGTKTTFAHTPGEVLPQLPVYESNETIRYYGWFHYGDGTQFFPETPVTEDIYIELWYDYLPQEDAVTEAPQATEVPEEAAEEAAREPLSLVRLGPALIFSVMLTAVCIVGLLRSRNDGR